VQQAVAARDAAFTPRPTPGKRPVGRPKVLAPLGVQAPPGERHVWAQLKLRWSGGEHASALHSKSSSSSSSSRSSSMHLQGRRGRGRGRGLETLEISKTTTEEDEGEVRSHKTRLRL